MTENFKDLIDYAKEKLELNTRDWTHGFRKF